jgi:hypothetical protein
MQNYVASIINMQPNTSKVLQGERNADIIRTEIVTRGYANPQMAISNIRYNSKGSSAAAARAKLMMTTDRPFVNPVVLCTAMIDANGIYNFVMDTPYLLPHGRHFL